MKKPQGSSFLAEVETLLNQALGWPNGTKSLKEVCERHSGSRVYIPTATELYVGWRNKQIRDKFKGDNCGELAIEWGLSDIQVWRIVNKV